MGPPAGQGGGGEGARGRRGRVEGGGLRWGRKVEGLGGVEGRISEGLGGRGGDGGVGARSWPVPALLSKTRRQRNAQNMDERQQKNHHCPVEKAGSRLAPGRNKTKGSEV